HSGGYRCVTDRELDTQDPRNDPDTDVSRADLFWSVRDEAAGERLLALLARYGIPFTPRGNIEFPNEKKEFDAEVSYTIDRSILRAIAKIALNYLAKMSGCQDFEFVYRPDFDAIRCFVRYDEGNVNDFVQVQT